MGKRNGRVFGIETMENAEKIDLSSNNWSFKVRMPLSKTWSMKIKKTPPKNTMSKEKIKELERKIDKTIKDAIKWKAEKNK